MSIGSEDIMSFLNIFWFFVFNPVTWLVVAGLALKRVRLMYLILFGTLAHFCSMIGLMVYNGTNVTETLLDFGWLVFMVPISIAAGTIVALMVFYLLKFRARFENRDQLETADE